MGRRLVILTVATFAMSGVIAAVAPQRTPLDGVWDYLPPLRGQASYQSGRYTMFFTRLDSAPPAGALSEAAQAKLYRTLMLQSGTFSIADTIVTMRVEHGKNPNQRGTTWRWSYALKSDTVIWHVLDSLGRVTSSGKSIRAK
jgi:hypothetical protein